MYFEALCVNTARVTHVILCFDTLEPRDLRHNFGRGLGDMRGVAMPIAILAIVALGLIAPVNAYSSVAGSCEHAGVVHGIDAAPPQRGDGGYKLRIGHRGERPWRDRPGGPHRSRTAQGFPRLRRGRRRDQAVGRMGQRRDAGRMPGASPVLARGDARRFPQHRDRHRRPPVDRPRGGFGSRKGLGDQVQGDRGPGLRDLVRVRADVRRGNRGGRRREGTYTRRARPRAPRKRRGRRRRRPRAVQGRRGARRLGR